jgi:hypothetical protein
MSLDQLVFDQKTWNRPSCRYLRYCRNQFAKICKLQQKEFPNNGPRWRQRVKIKTIEKGLESLGQAL